MPMEITVRNRRLEKTGKIIRGCDAVRFYIPVDRGRDAPVGDVYVLVWPESYSSAERTIPNARIVGMIRIESDTLPYAELHDPDLRREDWYYEAWRLYPPEDVRIPWPFWVRKFVEIVKPDVPMSLWPKPDQQLLAEATREPNEGSIGILGDWLEERGHDREYAELWVERMIWKQNRVEVLETILE